MKLKDIKEIINRHIDCKDCNDSECDFDCSSYVGKLILDDIMERVENEPVKIEPLDLLPNIKFTFRGVCQVLPADAEDGDVWAVSTEFAKFGFPDSYKAEINNFYYYKGKWNLLPILNDLRV